MPRWVLVGLVVVVLTAASVGGAAGGVGAGTATTDDSNEVRSAALVQDGADAQEFDRTYFDITVHENGSATWTFRYERTLETDEIDAFESFAEEFESEETALYDRFVRQAEGLTETGAERTDREMEATNFDRHAGVEHRFGASGVVEMTFLWEGFAVAADDGSRVVVGDAFDGLFIDVDQQLIVRPGDGLVFASADPQGEYSATSLSNADSMTWFGEHDFAPDQPRVVFETEAGDSASWLTGPDTGWWQLAAALVIGAALVGGFVWWRHATADRARAEPDAEADGADEVEVALPPDELLSDEDIVVGIIRENGGRMKQVEIVSETDWSKSKVSMLLSEMEEDGTISKLRVGRENIISLDGYEPEATKSPFED